MRHVALDERQRQSVRRVQKREIAEPRARAQRRRREAQIHARAGDVEHVVIGRRIHVVHDSRRARRSRSAQRSRRNRQRGRAARREPAHGNPRLRVTSAELERRSRAERQCSRDRRVRAQRQCLARGEIFEPRMLRAEALPRDENRIARGNLQRSREAVGVERQRSRARLFDRSRARQVPERRVRIRVQRRRRGRLHGEHPAYGKSGKVRERHRRPVGNREPTLECVGRARVGVRERHPRSRAGNRRLAADGIDRAALEGDVRAAGNRKRAPRHLDAAAEGIRSRVFDDDVAFRPNVVRLTVHGVSGERRRGAVARERDVPVQVNRAAVGPRLVIFKCRRSRNGDVPGRVNRAAESLRTVVFKCRRSRNGDGPARVNHAAGIHRNVVFKCRRSRNGDGLARGNRAVPHVRAHVPNRHVLARDADSADEKRERVGVGTVNDEIRQIQRQRTFGGEEEVVRLSLDRALRSRGRRFQREHGVAREGNLGARARVAREHDDAAALNGVLDLVERVARSDLRRAVGFIDGDVRGGRGNGGNTERGGEERGDCDDVFHNVILADFLVGFLGKWDARERPHKIPLISQVRFY